MAPFHVASKKKAFLAHGLLSQAAFAPWLILTGRFRATQHNSQQSNATLHNIPQRNTTHRNTARHGSARCDATHRNPTHRNATHHNATQRTHMHAHTHAPLFTQKPHAPRVRRAARLFLVPEALEPSRHGRHLLPCRWIRAALVKNDGALARAMHTGRISHAIVCLPAWFDHEMLGAACSHDLRRPNVSTACVRYHCLSTALSVSVCPSFAHVRGSAQAEHTLLDNPAHPFRADAKMHARVRRRAVHSRSHMA